MRDSPAVRRTGHTGRSYWQVLKRGLVAASWVHLAFCGLFFGLGAPLMGWANLGSIALYLGAYALLQQRHNHAAMALAWSEILLHALVATSVLGWDSGFHYYVLLLMPLVFMSPVRRQRTNLLLGVALAGFYLGLDVLSHRQSPLNSLSPTVLGSVRAFNVLATLTLLAYMASYYGVSSFSVQ